MRSNLKRFFAFWLAATLLVGSSGSNSQAQNSVDLTLIVAIDTSRSVDDRRYQLQTDGIAKALEDTSVIETILGGYHGAINFAVIAWADKSRFSLPWTRIGSAKEARLVAAKVRSMPKLDGEFTCLARMLRNLTDTVLPSMPVATRRTVVDVSGDGIDNCDPQSAMPTARDALVEQGVTINGLPIITDDGEIVGAGAYRAPGNPMELLPAPRNQDPVTLDSWYKQNVIGGFGSFIQPADGYADFGRAMRQKFVLEISRAQHRFNNQVGPDVALKRGKRIAKDRGLCELAAIDAGTNGRLGSTYAEPSERRRRNERNGVGSEPSSQHGERHSNGCNDQKPLPRGNL